MIRLLYKPSSFDFIAVSGGMDSMALADFVRRYNKTILHFNHGTEFGHRAQTFVEDYARECDLPIVVGRTTRDKLTHESWEEYWRNQRYGFLGTINGTIALAHHLDDAVETYLFYMINGKQWTIPSRRDNILRPFLSTPKVEIVGWVDRNRVPYIDDPSNYDTKYTRSKIRHNLMKVVEDINPGIRTVVRSMIMEMSDSI